MFGIGFFELVIIAVVALIFVGPKRLPDVMKQAGRFFVQVRRTTNDVKSTFDDVVRQAENEIRREEAEHMKTLTAAAKPVQPALPEGSSVAPPADGAAPVTATVIHPETPSGSRSFQPGAPRDPMAGEAGWGLAAPSEPTNVTPSSTVGDSKET